MLIMEDVLFFIHHGFRHVLDLHGLDHVYFFISIGVLFTVKDWKKALKFITLFTIGHTISFGLSVYEVVEFNGKIIELLIAITILISLLNNLYLVYQKKLDKLNVALLFSLLFGLIHGLGFSNYFKILLDKGDNKLIPLLEFSTGIELAQIVVVSSLLALSYLVINILKLKRVYWILSVTLILLAIIIPLTYSRI